MHVTWVTGTQMKSKAYNPSYFGGALSAFSQKFRFLSNYAGCPEGSPV